MVWFLLTLDIAVASLMVFGNPEAIRHIEVWGVVLALLIVSGITFVLAAEETTFVITILILG